MFDEIGPIEKVEQFEEPWKRFAYQKNLQRKRDGEDVHQEVLDDLKPRVWASKETAREAIEDYNEVLAAIGLEALPDDSLRIICSS